MLAGKAAFISGGAQRIGAAIARCLHNAGMNLTIHYRDSQIAAGKLCIELEAQRPDSVQLLQGDLLNINSLPHLVEQTVTRWERLDVLINNASSYYPTPIDSATEGHWNELLGSNLKAPFFLAQAALPELRQNQGSIVNIVDIHAERPRTGHPIYSIAKAGLAMLTRSLAWELKPTVRVNGVAPGAILWSAPDMDPSTRDEILTKIALGRLGDPDDIARAVLFLIRDGGYITGQIINVDGGRTLFM